MSNQPTPPSSCCVSLLLGRGAVLDVGLPHLPRQTGLVDPEVSRTRGALERHPEPEGVSDGPGLLRAFRCTDELARRPSPRLWCGGPGLPARWEGALGLADPVALRRAGRCARCQLGKDTARIGGDSGEVGKRHGREVSSRDGGGYTVCDGGVELAYLPGGPGGSHRLPPSDAAASTIVASAALSGPALAAREFVGQPPLCPSAGGRAVRLARALGPMICWHRSCYRCDA